jgi:predicted PurR-regulated permease PerM
MSDSSLINSESLYDMMNISAIKVFHNIFISVIFLHTILIEGIKIEEMVIRLEPKTEEKPIRDICNSLQKVAQNSFQLKIFIFLPFFFFFFGFFINKMKKVVN